MAMQYERVPVMPTPSADLDGVIYKYAGTSNDKFDRGKYYKCITTTERITDSQGKYIETTWINDKGVDVRYKNVGKDPYSKVNGVDAPLQGILKPGDKYFTAHGGFSTYDVTFTWHIWQQVEIDEHDTAKYFSQANVAYLLSELTERLKQTHINE